MIVLVLLAAALAFMGMLGGAAQQFTQMAKRTPSEAAANRPNAGEEGVLPEAPVTPQPAYRPIENPYQRASGRLPQPVARGGDLRTDFNREGERFDGSAWRSEGDILPASFTASSDGGGHKFARLPMSERVNRPLASAVPAPAVRRSAHTGSSGVSRTALASLQDSGEWNLPIQNHRWHLTSLYGNRRHPISGAMRFHAGLDIGVEEGTPIHPVRPGVVSEVYTNGGAGKVVVVTHRDGFKSRYLHLSAQLVRVGQVVDTSSVIGKAGETGHATGPHLHLEILNPQGDTVNPHGLLFPRRTVTV